MRAQQPSIGDEKCILHVARRMVFGNIERFEIVVVVFDVRTAGDLEAHAPKDIDDLVDHQRQRMAAAALPARAGEGDVDALGFKRLRLGLIFERAQTLV